MGACMSEQTLTSATVVRTIQPSQGGGSVIKISKGVERVREHEIAGGGNGGTESTSNGTVNVVTQSTVKMDGVRDTDSS